MLSKAKASREAFLESLVITKAVANLVITKPLFHFIDNFIFD